MPHTFAEIQNIMQVSFTDAGCEGTLVLVDHIFVWVSQQEQQAIIRGHLGQMTLPNPPTSVSVARRKVVTEYRVEVDWDAIRAYLSHPQGQPQFKDPSVELAVLRLVERKKMTMPSTVSRTSPRPIPRAKYERVAFRFTIATCYAYARKNPGSSTRSPRPPRSSYSPRSSCSCSCCCSCTRSTRSCCCFSTPTRFVSPKNHDCDRDRLTRVSLSNYARAYPGRKSGKSNYRALRAADLRTDRSLGPADGGFS